MIKCLVLFSLILLFNKSNGQQEKPLKVMVLYESLCPDSVSFFKKQLAPNFETFKDFIDISLVPFGKAHSLDNGAMFQCQHGPPECFGNRVQSCALAQTYDQNAHVTFGVCQMSGHAEKSGEECAKLAGIPYDSLDVCLNTEIGTVLQLQAEAITHSYKPAFIPTIVYDEQFDENLQDRSMSNFAGVMCELLLKKGVEASYEVCSKLNA